ncbi:Oxidoreductase, molybdopterin-binding domain-containing protein [Chaetomium tenue]|uniref:Oxidoreductase, molybdopterin-binding domain-containing protein n=1 Tax=Chaetomium tenue TaxID=1854479 RepID=A0ACB7NYR0_9PEZI|nr:Oxidoreductase, molybdopterin-binding domain-containing protein [Chaetomium globosum]
MATRTPKHLATSILRQFGRRDATELAICRPYRLRPRHIHISARRPSNDAPRVPHPKLPTGRAPPYQARAAPLSFLVGGGVAASLLAYSQLAEDNPGVVDRAPASTDDRDPSLPRFRLADIRKHDASSSQPWVTFEDKVYDITDWIAAHPGGDVILRAAGASIEPYWNIFTIHKAPHVREILQQYQIGFIDAADLGPDGLPAAETVEDPFVNDPIRDPRLITHTAKPRNAEPPNEELDRTFKTPNELFYVRHHMWVPVVEEAKAGEHLLSIELPDGEIKQYTLEDLKTKFPTHKVTAVLQCSGNRRNDMTRHAGKTNGLQWGVGAISNAEWEGVRLSDILADAGLKVRDAASPTPNSSQIPNTEDQVDANAFHVQFTGLEAYGASIPLAKALDPRGDVLLAFGMNGETLPRDHGFPLRAVVPGHVAARSVKWLSKIVVSDEESTSQWQRRDYKSFGPNEGANPNWDRAVSIQEMPVTSAITGVWVGDCVRRGRVPWMGTSDNSTTTPNGSRILDMAAVSKKVGFTPKPTDTNLPATPCPPTTPADEPVAVQGYAYSGGGRAITRVDVSLDGGKTWDQAELVNDRAESPHPGNKAWAWTRWRYVGALPILTLPTDTTCDTTNTAERSGCHDRKAPKQCTTLVVKATDDAYNTQPENHRGIYNVRGNLATAWHRVKICPRCTGGGGAAGDGKGGLTWSTGETFGCGFRKEAEEVREGMRRQGVVANGGNGNEGSN